MKKTFFALPALLAASLLVASCESPTGGNANAPKNTAANNTAANSTANPASAEADVKKLIDDLAAALSKNDAAALDKIYADDYTLVTQTGEVTTKAARMEAIKSGDLKFENVSFTDVKVRSFGDGAVVNASSAGKSTNKGVTVDTKFKITFVATKGKDGWRLSSAQLTTIADAGKPDDSAKAANANTNANTNTNK